MWLGYEHTPQSLLLLLLLLQHEWAGLDCHCALSSDPFHICRISPSSLWGCQGKRRGGEVLL